MIHVFFFVYKQRKKHVSPDVYVSLIVKTQFFIINHQLMDDKTPKTPVLMYYFFAYVSYFYVTQPNVTKAT